MAESQLIKFYLGQGPDDKGRMVDEILSWSDEQLEDVHDYIQWLFPLNERSAFNTSAPILSEEDIIAFKNPQPRQKLLLSFARMLDFYGFMTSVAGDVFKISKSKDFERKSRNWLTRYNHNFLRITRILKSLVSLHCQKFAKTFLDALEEVFNDNSPIIGQKSLEYWEEALKR